MTLNPALTRMPSEPDLNREVFVPCGFCRTGAGRGRETKPVAAFLTHLEERLSRVPLNGLISPEQAATVPFQP